MEHYTCQQYYDTRGRTRYPVSVAAWFPISKRSTETQLLTCIHEFSQNLDRKKQTDIAILDFCKAFDNVPHNR